MYHKFNIRFSNIEYLNIFKTPEEIKYPVLPHEHDLIEHALQIIRTDYRKNLDEKMEVAGGADDWHDGAFITTDEQAKRIAQQARELSVFNGAPEVDYPEKSLDVVTLGSRVVVNQDGYRFPLDIVGFRIGHPTDLIDITTEEEVEPISPEAPMARSIIGLSIGDIAKIELHGQLRIIEILNIDQDAIRMHFSLER